MRKFLLLSLIFASLNSAFALEIVYPKSNPAKINAKSTFFIGSVNPSDSLKINDITVKTGPSGAFAQVVPLSIGVNNFVINSGSDTLNFTIERPQPAALGGVAPVLIEYPPMSNFYVKTEGAPLRMTPVDSGINRLSHLSKDTQLLINGEKGDFYRVYLNSKLVGWIAKTNVEPKEINSNFSTPISPVKIKDFKIKHDSEFCIYEFDLPSKTPFTISEENGITLQLFNIEGEVDNTYILNVPVHKLIGYDVFYEGNKLVLKIRRMPQICFDKPLKDIVIAVDAGHGGTEAGAIGCCGDKEKDINLKISKNLQKELEARGAKVVMTRNDDVNVSLAARVNTAREKDSALLISVHANALPDGADPIKNKGTSVYYYHNQAKSLSENILTSMTTQLGTQDDKVRQGSLALVRPTSSVSVLIEVAYIINPDDYALLSDEKFQQDCAKAIADGIEKYLLN